jgi:hypothetical protein
MVIPDLKVSIVDGTAPHVIEPTAPGAIEDYINLGSAWDSQALALHKDEILEMKSQIQEAFQSAYTIFNEAEKIHDEWEKIYIENMDFAKVDSVTENLIEQLFEGKDLAKTALVRHRFFGASTPIGPVDFITNLTEDISKRYFIKGRPGTGKSTLLNKLAAYAQQKGFDVEVYHCGFDPYSLDMVIIQELDTAIFDSTAPHEYYPDRDSDIVIDMYENAVTPGTDEKYVVELEDIIARYKAKMNEATAFLAKAKALHDDMEIFYIDAMDFRKVEELQESINQEFNRIAIIKG